MRNFFCTIALLLVAATTADAADRYGAYNNRGDNGRQSSRHTYYFPDRNTLVIQQTSGNSTFFYSAPITQYGVPQTSYHNYGGNSYIIPPSRGVRPIW